MKPEPCGTIIMKKPLLKIGRGFCYIMRFKTSIEMQAGMPRQTEAATVYQLIATVTPVRSPRALTARREASP